MNQIEFQVQMSRLIDQFGKHSYGTERVALVWEEVKEFNPQWFKKTVDKFIGEFRNAPLMPDFREEISKERERLWHLEKQRHSQDSREFWESSFLPEEEKWICKTIRDRLSRKISDEDFSQFQKLLNRVQDNKEEQS